jgi:hypothetical protein
VITSVPIAPLVSVQSVVLAVTKCEVTRASVSAGSMPMVIAVPRGISEHFAFASSVIESVASVASWQPCARIAAAATAPRQPSSANRLEPRGTITNEILQRAAAHGQDLA